ncbi:hypothetical protein [Pontibacter sp. SGAir0037]|uniref:hypothetical protein n=1 Tax=Pontibacter sp. SGAir0037 TaxID=2571030 RepID=UPI0010CD07F0|nr:hypothetical protein [Pontibacter sp. SGAir0037]QCR21644.1 hypothetical protein C1N53_04325 [Pontibacter sp. SGAir0037]
MPDMYLSLRNLPDDLRKTAEDTAAAIARSVKGVGQVYYLCSTREASESWSCFPAMDRTYHYDSLFFMLALLKEPVTTRLEDLEDQLDRICQTDLQTTVITAMPLIQASRLIKARDRFYGSICRSELLLYHDGSSPLPDAIAPEQLSSWMPEDSYYWQTAFDQGCRCIQEATQHLQEQAWQQTVLALRQAATCFLSAALFSATGFAAPLHYSPAKLLNLCTMFTAQFFQIFPGTPDKEEAMSALIFHPDQKDLVHLSSEHTHYLHCLFKRFKKLKETVQQQYNQLRVLHH